MKTTRETLIDRLCQLQKEQEEMINTINTSKNPDYLIMLGKRLEKNKALINFGKSCIKQN